MPNPTTHIHTNSNHGYDSGCHSLAEDFLGDIDNNCPECAKALAIVIQDAIEDHLREFEE